MGYFLKIPFYHVLHFAGNADYKRDSMENSKGKNRRDG